MARRTSRWATRSRPDRSGRRTGLLRARIADLMPQAQADLREMVSMRSVHDASQFPPAECRRMVDFVVGAFTDVGLQDVRGYETADGSQTVCGHRPGPTGSPTVLLYFHTDVRPPLDESAWATPVWELTERNGRWYGRGAADCKGNIAAHLTALRALGDDLPVNVKIVGEGSEEQGTGGLEGFVAQRSELLAADAILYGDAGNAAVGAPSLTGSFRGHAGVRVTVRTMRRARPSGTFGGAAPDALAALVAMLATLRDPHGNTTVAGLDGSQTWRGAAYPANRFRRDAEVLDGVDLLGERVEDMVWARPSATVLGIDCPPVAGSSAVIHAEATARIDLRVPPGTNARRAQEALIAHLEAVAPWHVQVECDPEADGEPFVGTLSGPGYETMTGAMRDTYGVSPVIQGRGGSIPVVSVFAETFPRAEILLLGVEEPLCRIHAPNESVDPTEIANMALVEALFLQRYATAVAS